MKPRTFVSTFCFFILFLSSIDGQTKLLRNILSPEDGLPNSQIYDIQQDQRGFLWIGTRDGLVRFDGQDLLIFSPKNDGLPFNNCYDLELDNNGNLWIASNADYGGVCLFNTKTFDYTHYNVSLSNKEDGLSSAAITSTIILSDSTVLFSTKDFKLNLLNLNTDKFLHFDLNEYLDSSIQVSRFFDMMLNPRNEESLIISCSAGLFEFNMLNKSFDQRIYTTNWTPEKMVSHPSYPEVVWVAASSKGGIIQLHLDDFHQSVFHRPDETLLTVENKFEQSKGTGRSFNSQILEVKSESELWVPENGLGLGIFDLNAKEFSFEEFKGFSSESGPINTIFVNHKDEVWIGTDLKGISYFSGGHNSIDIIPIGQSAGDRVVNRNFQITEDAVLLSILHEPTLLKYDLDQGQITENFEFPNEDYFRSLLAVGDTIYYGSNQSFGIFKDDFSRVERIIDKPANEFYKGKFSGLIQDSYGQIWMIDWGYGIHMYNGEVHSIEGNLNGRGLRHFWNHEIVIGPNKQVWIGSQDGLYSIDPLTLKITTHAHHDSLNGLVNANIKSIVFDDKEMMWVASFGGGLSCLTNENGFWTLQNHYNSKNGLPSDRIYDLIKDDNGNLWIWTNEGLCVMQQIGNKPQFTYFSESRNIPVGKNGTWFTKLSDGRLSFRYTVGFAIFDPESLLLMRRPSVLAPVITSFVDLLDGQSINSALIENFVNLGANHNQFIIQYSSPMYSRTHQLSYRYRLNGLNDDWIYNQNSKQINFSNVVHGEYLFELQVADESLNWLPLKNPLRIFIATPWYKTATFNILILVLLGFMTYYIINYLNGRQTLKLRLKEQEKEALNLKKLDKMKSNFFAQISHEFRTPLTLILGMSKQLSNKIPKNEKNRLVTIDNNAKELLNQINHILDLSRLEFAEPSLNIQTSDIVQFLKSINASFHSYLEDQDKILEFKTDNGEEVMDYDAETVRNIYTNLLSNAIKFSPKGSLIEIKVNKTNTELFIQVKDRGMGVPSEDIPYLFDSYFRSDQHKGFAGTGLGLALVKKWAGNINARIMVESTLNVGSTFTLVLPINTSEKIQEQLPIATINSTRSNQTLSIELPTLVLVEDHEEMAKYLMELLGKEYNCIRAPDGMSGYEVILDQMPDIIVSDIMMPVMNGYELINKIKTNPLTDHIPALLLTAKSRHEEKIQGLQVGAEAYISKPFDEDELKITLRNLLSLREQNQKKVQESFQNSESKERNKSQFLKRVDEMVLKHSKEDLSNDQLAKLMQVSRNQLYRKIKALTGLSINKYCNQVRLLRAYRLLATTSKTISEVAYAVGYSDPNYFSRVFSETFDKPPTEARAG